MSLSFAHLWQQLSSNPILATSLFLTLAVIFVNGWTDAPNAIATAVTTRALPVNVAIFLAAICNFAGVLFFTLGHTGVAQTIYYMVDFSGNTQHASIALCAALCAIVLWSVAAWFFGIPTSESHALIAGLSGAAIALQGGFAGISGGQWLKVIYGLVFATLCGFLGGFLAAKLTVYCCRRQDRRRTSSFFRQGQIFTAAAMAFLHGAQDGQKFIGVFLLGICLAQGQTDQTSFFLPLWLPVLCAIIMTFGTASGGRRIIKAVGLDMVRLESYQGFAADLAAATCLFLSTWAGYPVSTTHTKTTAIMGVGAARRFSLVNWNIAKEMALAWLCTFPGCGFIGFAAAYLFLPLFS